MAEPVLTPELRSLAARVAVERMRPATWALASELRQQLRAQLAAGVPARSLAEDLRRQIEAASAPATPRA